MESKTASQVLYENGISIMEMNDEFNCSLLKSMEEYKNSVLESVVREIEENSSPLLVKAYVIEILKKGI